MSGGFWEYFNLKAQISASRVISSPRGSNPNIKAQISASRLKSQLRISNLTLKLQIPASRLFLSRGFGRLLESLLKCLGAWGRHAENFRVSGGFGETFNLKAQISASRVKSSPQGSNPNIKALISTSRLKSQPQGSNPSLEALSV